MSAGLVTFYLVRHGKKVGASGDASLSAVGREQALATARYLQGRPLGGVYASPLRRARETAACIAASLGLAVVEDARLRERANWGDLPGQSLSEFVAMWERSTRDPTYTPPVGDSARQAGDRLAAFLREVAATGRHEELVVVTHGGLITDFLAHSLPVAELARWHPDFLAARSSLVAECSVTVVRYDGTRFTVEAFAGVEHLA